MRTISPTKRTRGRGATLGRPRSPRADRAILQAALELFLERGFDGVGIEQIAERAGVARTTVYRRWSSKEDMIAEAISHARGSADEEALRGALPRQATTRAVIDALARILGSQDYTRMLARLVGSIPDHPGLMAAYWQTYLVPRRRAAVEALAAARAEGLIREDSDAEVLLDLLGGALMYRLLVYPRQKSEADIRSYLRAIMREIGLGVQEPRGRK